MQRWLEQQAENLQKEYDKANTPQTGGAEPTRSADPDAGAGPSSGVEATPSFSRFSSLTSALTPTLDLSKQLGEITSVGKQIGDIKSVSKQLSNITSALSFPPSGPQPADGDAQKAPGRSEDAIEADRLRSIVRQLEDEAQRAARRIATLEELLEEHEGGEGGGRPQSRCAGPSAPRTLCASARTCPARPPRACAARLP
jgi:hypothetical protein